MSAAAIDLAELTLYTPEQAGEIMSGHAKGAVSGWWIREQIRQGRFTYTPVGRRVMLSRPQIAAIIADLEVPATRRTPRRRTSAR